MSDSELPLEFGKKTSSAQQHLQHSVDSSSHHQHHRGGGRGGRGRGRGAHAHHHQQHHNNNNYNNSSNRRFSGHKRPFVGGRGAHHHHHHESDGSAARYFSASMLQNPWRAWLEPDAVDESADAQTTHDSAVVDAPPAQLHDIVEYTSQAGQRRNLVRVSGPFDAGVAPSVALEAAGRLLRVSLAAAALLADQVDAVDQAFVLHTGHDRPRRDALVALAARENSGDWSYSLALPAAADGESLTSCLVACPVRGSAVSQRLLFVDVGVLVSRDAEDDVESSPIEPQSPPPE